MLEPGRGHVLLQRVPGSGYKPASGCEVVLTSIHSLRL